MRLKHPGHVDDIVGSLRVAHQNERVGVALGTLPDDFFCCGFPMQMTSYLGADALGLSASAISSRPVENTPNQPRNKITREPAWAGLQQRSMMTAITPVCDLTCFRPYRTTVLVSLHNAATLLVRIDFISVAAIFVSAAPRLTQQVHYRIHCRNHAFLQF